MRDSRSILPGPINERRPALFTLSPFTATSGGIKSGGSGNDGTLGQFTVTRLRIACVYPSTRGKRISNAALWGKGCTWYRFTLGGEGPWDVALKGITSNGTPRTFETSSVN